MLKNNRINKVIESICYYCGVKFQAKTLSSMYCSKKCTHKYHYDKKLGKVGIHTKKCRTCEKEFRPNSSAAFCSDHCKKEEHLKRSKRSYNRIRNEMKQWAIKYKGGKCSKCEEFHIACLQFHHLDPKQKDFTIGESCKINSRINKEIIRKELDKCILICANCHFKLHWENKQLTQMKAQDKQ